MIEFKCEKCGHFYKVAVAYSGKPVKCKICKHVMTVPVSTPTPFGYCVDVAYKADGITPDFDEFFQALAKEEREAPALINN